MTTIAKRFLKSTGLAALAAAGIAFAAPPTVDIATGPLFSGRGNVHPNMLLNLSVEFPTVGAAYRDNYNGANEYLGYFNPGQCYTYPTTVSTSSSSSTSTGNTTNNTNPTPNQTTTTTTTTDVTTTVTTTVDNVTTVPGTPAVYGPDGYVSRNTKIFSGNKAGATPVYTTANLNTADGTFTGVAGYQNGSGSSINAPNGSTYFTRSKLDKPATSTSYNHTPEITTTVTTAIPYPDLNEATGYFSISKAADANRECGGDSFSGNFLNWAVSSSIDMLRYAMTGGDRVIDEVDKTVLQRAWLPDGSYNSNSNFYADGTYFPRKSITSPNRVTPFTTGTLYVVSCRNRILFSNTNSGGNCDTARTSGNPPTLVKTDKYFGEYLARVRVCDATEGPTRVDLCQKYGSNYKPEGQLQRNSDKIRVGALGYLTEYDTGNNNLYGGVVRGPIKYVGPKKFDAPSFAESTNDRPEWDATTGVFYNNPEDPANRTSATNSGVLNYLNKFGRTDPSRSGAYKSWDPVGELYYEALRYLQGKQPTNGSTNQTSAIRALGTKTTDANFPVLTTLTDPITASCQSNYIVTIGDVNTHRDAYIPGSPGRGSDGARAADTVDAGKTPAFNVVTWTKKVSEMEVDSGGTFGNLARRSNLTDLDTKNGGSTDGTYFMAGMAYWANTNDIRIDKPVRVKTFSIDVDEGGNGDINDTNTRGIKPRNSQFYLAAKYGGFDDKNKDGNPFKTYGIDGVTVVNDNSEWSTNGTDPDNYFLASNPRKMIDSIKRVFQVVASKSGTISGVTLTTSKISTGDSYVYQPGFDPSKWSGNLLKLKLTLVDIGTGDKNAPGYEPNNVVTIQDATTPTWDAGIVLTGKPATTTPAAAAVAPNPAPDARNIYTAQVNADGSLTTVEFQWASLTEDQKTSLSKSPSGSQEDDGLGEKRVNYLRGSRVDEIGSANGIFRQRDRVLGDIINSNPTYVAAPAPNIQGDGYGTFYNARKNRTKAVYVGANDGMLHAFNASDGTELFAYVPNALIGALNQLTDPDYVHRPYVDGTMTVKEAKIGSTWKTLLASGMGGGAQGVFVLDVTNPADFAGGLGAIWEFTDRDDRDMGNLTSPPQIAKFRTGTDTATQAPIYKYFVVVPSGLNNYKDDGHSNFGTADEGQGALFLLSLDKPSDEAWQLGANYYKITTPVKDVNLKNGLSAPEMVVGNDGAVLYAYAGDLQGNLWRFDFTGGPWSGAINSTPLFAALDGSSNRQPITMQPKVVLAPGGGYVVLFGTGKYVENADAAPANFKTQSFYGILDDTVTKVSGRSKLQARTLSKDTKAGSDAMKVTGSDFIYGSKTGQKQGWYMDFYQSGGVTGTGERAITNPLIAYGRLFFNSLITGSDPCATGGGRTYALSALTGLPINSEGLSESGGVTGEASTVGMLSSPVLFETGTTVGDRDSIGKRNAKKNFAVFNFGTGGVQGTAAQATNGTGSFMPPAGRMSWREIVNWKQLHNQ
ncbi:MAG: PilC/PilY family type IV pilus protein [Burkholderiaceae bacterium]